MRLPATCISILGAFALAAPAVAQSGQPAPGQPAPGQPAQAAQPAENARPPKLILAIAVDQFSADLFAEYRRHFQHGLARLQEGAVFASGFQSHAATETCPGHATLLTGVRPARSRIIANNWFDPGIARADKRIYCSEDPRDPASTSDEPVVSAGLLKVPTLGDRLKAANRASRNVALSGKDRSAVMMSGHDADAVYWWKSGRFVTFGGRKASRAVEAANGQAAALIAKGESQLTPPQWCAARDRAVPVAGFTVGTARFPLKAGDEGGFRASPRLDAGTADLAIRLADEMELGRRSAPDVLSVSFSATDYIGHRYGHQGVEMCIQLAELDKQIGRILDHLDQRGVDYVAVLSADHGGFDAPERLGQQALPAAERADVALAPGELGKAITARTGIAAPSGDLIYADGAFGDYYVSRALSPEQKARVLGELVAMLKAHPQVGAVYTASEIAAAPMPSGSPQDWTLLQRARASFDPERSGDLVSMLKRAVVPISRPSSGVVATHGSPWDYDRRVPILFWRRGVAGFEQPAPVETVDIAPSLAALLRLPVRDGEFDGRCLDIDGSAADTCGR